MRALAERWRRLPIADPVQRQIAGFYQTVLAVWIGLAVIGIPLIILRGIQESTSAAAAPPPPEIAQQLSLLGVATPMLLIAPAVALAVLRRGRLELSVALAAWGLLIGHSMAAYLFGWNDPSIMVVFQIPIALAGLLGGRRLLMFVSAYSLLAVGAIGFLMTMAPPQAGFISARFTLDTTPLTNGEMLQPMIFFVAVTLLTTLLTSQVRAALRQALERSQGREVELEEIRASLEGTVQARTADLEAALAESRRQAAEQTELLRQLSEQRAALREMSVPVLPVSAATLVMPLVGALDGDRLDQVQEQALSQLQATGARTLLLDITGVPVVDTHVAHGLMQVVSAGRLLGAQVVLVGIRPEVAQSIVGLGVQFTDVRTFSDLQSALAQMRR